MSQLSAVHHEVIGTPSVKCTTAAITPAPAGIGRPTKYFFPGRPGLEGCGFVVMLKRANRLAPAIRKAKQKIEPSWMILVRIAGSIVVGRSLNPHIHASNAGATPKVI